MCIRDRYKPIPDDEITDLEQDYDVQLEKQEYINVEEKKYTARVFDKNKKINLSLIHI